jgi:hypothetical protein
LIAEAAVVAAYLMRRSADRAPQQVSDPVLQNAVGREPYRVADALGFEKLVHLGIGESRVAAKIEPLHAPLAGDHRLQHRAPAVGAVHVAGSQLKCIPHKRLPAGPGKSLNELHTAESRQLVGACVFEPEEWRIEI